MDWLLELAFGVLFSYTFVRDTKYGHHANEPFSVMDNITSINTERWPAGAYIWKVMADGREAESGKWIKEQQL